nr:hypothetical protein [Tanacetum cinerariifolium]
MSPKPNLVFHPTPIAIQTDHSAFNVQLNLAKPAEDLSHTNRPSAPIIEEWVSNSKDDSETTAPQIAHSSVQSTKQVTVCRSVDHLINDCNFYAKPKSQPTPRNNTHRGYNKLHASFTKKFPQKHIVPATVLPKSKPIFVTAVRPICADVPKIMMTRPRHAYSINTRSNSTIRRHKTWEESVIKDPEEESSEKTPTETKSKDKGKGILIEEPKPIKKKQQVEMDEDHELATRLKAEE